MIDRTQVEIITRLSFCRNFCEIYKQLW